MSTTDSGFTISVTQHKYLSLDDHQMEALVTVTAAGLGRGHRDGATDEHGPTAAEVILVDCSGSMAYPHSKIEAARHATRAAIDVLADGVLFAVVEGRGDARVVYPHEGGLVAASTATKAAAKAVVHHLDAAGGTAFGTWLTLADELLGGCPDAVRHALLFTDGKNEWESGEQLGLVLDKIAGRFGCDALGIGDRWEPRELLRIVSVLNGQAAGVVRYADMAAQFEALMRGAMRKAVPDVTLRVRLRGNARLRYLKQVYPTLVDLTEQLARPDEMTAEVATGAWADEAREYRLCVEVDAAGHDTVEDFLAARVELDVHRADATGTAPVTPGLVLVRWTDNPRLSHQLPPGVVSTFDQERLTTAVLDGCAAYGRQQWADAETYLALAYRLARQLGNTTILARLSAFVEVVDEATGRLRLRTDVGMSELLDLEATSTRSSRHAGDRPAEPVAAGPPRVCANCGRANDADANVCEQCRWRLTS